MTAKRSRIGYVDFSGGPLNFVVRGIRPGDCEASPGCAHCYALAGLLRFGNGPERTTVYPERLGKLATARFAPPPGGHFRRGPGSRPFAFVCDTGDLFHESTDYGVLVEFMRVVERHVGVDFLVLTKRVFVMQSFMRWFCFKSGHLPPRNLWLGASVENQRVADERIPLLQDTPAAHRWLSVEPLLEPVNLWPYLGAWCPLCGWRQTSGEQVDRAAATSLSSNAPCPRCGRELSLSRRGIDWVVCGGESGPERRPFDKAWAGELWAQCRALGIPFFGKQGSDLYPGSPLLLAASPGGHPDVVLEFPPSGHA